VRADHTVIATGRHRVSIGTIGGASANDRKLLSTQCCRADPHRWGAGMIHQIDPERDQTLCGKSSGGCPGTKFMGTADRITCKGRLRSLEARTNAEARRQQFAQEQAEWGERNRQWWFAYNMYLSSPAWQAKRAKVLRRANGRCEGCGERRAVQVHHLRYPQGCWPGSPRWVALEKLFDLTAVCEDCHDDLHERP
jgi:5-methylcytosine-specific restriction endonuclease McrA